MQPNNNIHKCDATVSSEQNRQMHRVTVKICHEWEAVSSWTKSCIWNHKTDTSV